MEGSWKVEPVSFPDVRALTAALGVSETVATVLVRRGLHEPDAARAFLEPEGIAHDPLLLGDMAAAVERLRAAVERGERICVHGDYDVDGICATALATLALRELGADVVWHLPSRFEEGYGVSAATIARLAEEGVKLILTVDCGITAVAEVEEARRLGVDMIVTDHHRPGETLPDCPDRRHQALRLPVSRSLRHRRRGEARRRRSSVPPILRSPATPTSSRSRRSPTSSRSSTRTGRSPPPACAVSLAPRSPACAR